MKIVVRLLAILLSVAILGIAVVLIGFASLNVPPQSYGFFYSRAGFSVADTTNVWQARNLLPFNNRLIVVPIERHEVTFSAQGTLPNAELFSRLFFAQLDTYELTLSFDELLANFGYQVNGRLSFTLTEAGALAALNNNELLIDDQASFYARQTSLIQSFINDHLITTMNSLTTPLSNAALITQLQRALVAEFSHLEITNLSLTSQLPNLTLYQLAVETSLGRARAVEQANIQAMLREENARAAQEERLRLLERYGELLTRYPILLQLFMLDINSELLSRAGLGDFFPLTEATTDEVENANGNEVTD